MLRQCATTAITAVHAASIMFAMAAMLGRLVAQLKMPRLDAYFFSVQLASPLAIPRRVLLFRNFPRSSPNLNKGNNKYWNRHHAEKSRATFWQHVGGTDSESQKNGHKPQRCRPHAV